VGWVFSAEAALSAAAVAAAAALSAEALSAHPPAELVVG